MFLSLCQFPDHCVCVCVCGGGHRHVPSLFCVPLAIYSLTQCSQWLHVILPNYPWRALGHGNIEIPRGKHRGAKTRNRDPFTLTNIDPWEHWHVPARCGAIQTILCGGTHKKASSQFQSLVSFGGLFVWWHFCKRRKVVVCNFLCDRVTSNCENQYI